MLAYTAREDTEVHEATARNGLKAAVETDVGFRVRQMGDADLDRILELRGRLFDPAPRYPQAPSEREACSLCV
jgi:hypothetical protein